MNDVFEETTYTLRSHSASVTSICFLDFAQREFGTRWCLATGDSDGNIIVWDSEPFFDQLAQWYGHDGGILALLQDPRKERNSGPCLKFWSQGRDGCLHLWEWMVVIEKDNGTSLFLDDLIDTLPLGSGNFNSSHSSAVKLATPLPNKITTIRTGFGSFCRSDILKWKVKDQEIIYILSPSVNSAEIEVWEVGSQSMSTSMLSSEPSIINVGQFAVPPSAVSEAAAVLRTRCDGSEDQSQGTLLEAMKAQSGMCTCAIFLHNQFTHEVTNKNGNSVDLLISVCYESGSIFILKCHTSHQEDESSVTALVTLPVCKDPLLSFSLLRDDSGGAAVGSGAFVYVFSLDIALGKGVVTHRLPLAAPGSNASLLMRFVPRGQEGFVFGCWDSTIRCIPCNSIKETSPACVEKISAPHRSSVNSLAILSRENSCTLASGEKNGTILITKLLQK